MKRASLSPVQAPLELGQNSLWMPPLRVRLVLDGVEQTLVVSAFEGSFV
jgi:hypothetical protein